MDLSVRQLRKENSDLRFPQVGDFVRIPGGKNVAKEEIEPILTDSINPIAEELPLPVDRTAGFTMVKDLNGSLDVAVLLPFYLDRNSTRIVTDSAKLTKGKI